MANTAGHRRALIGLLWPTPQEGAAEDARVAAYSLLRSDIRRGDIVGIKGYPGRSKTDELSIFPLELQILTPCLHMLPTAHSGFTNVEQRFRMRHLDLIMNNATRQVFYTRAKIINYIRRFLDMRGFLEVETPMMSDLAGGATARPVARSNLLLLWPTPQANGTL